MGRFKYNLRGQIETGFDNSIDHELFGHPLNPEYQDLCQHNDKRIQEKDSDRRPKNESVEIEFEDPDNPF